jgi:hypothetical protein
MSSKALARIAAASTAAGSGTSASPSSPTCVENKLSRMVLAHVVCTQGDPHGPA